MEDVHIGGCTYWRMYILEAVHIGGYLEHHEHSKQGRRKPTCQGIVTFRQILLHPYIGILGQMQGRLMSFSTGGGIVKKLKKS